jgi:hypothetical protein
VVDPDWESADVGLEEMVLGYMGQPGNGQDARPALSHLTTVGDDQ